MRGGVTSCLLVGILLAPRSPRCPSIPKNSCPACATPARSSRSRAQGFRQPAESRPFAATTGVAELPCRRARDARSLRPRSAAGLGVVRLAPHVIVGPSQRGTRGARGVEPTPGIHADHAERRRPPRARRHRQRDSVSRFDLGIALRRGMWRRALAGSHRADDIPASHCPSCGGIARPGVVWFGENIDPTSSSAPPPPRPAPMSTSPSAPRRWSSPPPDSSITPSARRVHGGDQSRRNRRLADRRPADRRAG